MKQHQQQQLCLYGNQQEGHRIWSRNGHTFNCINKSLDQVASFAHNHFKFSKTTLQAQSQESIQCIHDLKLQNYQPVRCMHTITVQI